MPVPDPVPGSSETPASSVARFLATRESIAREKALRARRDGKRKPKGDAGGERVPVEPNGPNNLTGGAAAALEFDD